MGLNSSQLKTCIEQEKYKDEVQKDAADANKIGIRGTPGFVIGKLKDNGVVDGIVVKGAQPFSVFEQIINQQLTLN